MFSTHFPFIWLRDFREDILEIAQTETIIAYGGHMFANGSKRNAKSE